MVINRAATLPWTTMTLTTMAARITIRVMTIITMITRMTTRTDDYDNNENLYEVVVGLLQIRVAECSIGRTGKS